MESGLSGGLARSAGSTSMKAAAVPLIKNFERAVRVSGVRADLSFSRLALIECTAIHARRQYPLQTSGPGQIGFLSLVIAKQSIAFKPEKP